MQSKIIKYKNIILYVYTIVLLSINSVRIFNDSIWGDEGFSIRLASGGMDYLIQRTARDVHPPLYYMILKFFYALFEPNAVIGKFVSFLPIVLVCVIAVTYCRKKFGTMVSMIIVGTVTFTGNCVPMIVEIRMYTWALLFVFCNLLCIYELLEKECAKKTLWYWIGYAVFSLMAGYTHYYALIMVALMDAAMYVMLFIRDKKTWKKSFVSMMAMIVGYFPWLIILLEQFKSNSQSFWIEDIDVRGYLLYLFGENKWGKLLFIAFGISIISFYFVKDGFEFKRVKSDKANKWSIEWCSEFSFSSNERKLVFICLLATFGTIFIGTIVSVLLRPLYLARYIFPALGLVAVALAISFVKSFRNRVCVALLVLIMLASGCSQFLRIYNLEATYLTEETKQYMEENLLEEDKILTDNILLDWTVLEYYFPDVEVFHSEEIEIKDIDSKRVWLMLEHDEKLLKKCEEAGYSIKQTKELGIDFVFFTLYLLER